MRPRADNLKSIREWGLLIWPHCLSLMVDMFAVSLFSGIMLVRAVVPSHCGTPVCADAGPRSLAQYILNGKKVPLFGPDSSVLIPHDWYFCVYNAFSMFGDNLVRTPLARPPVSPLTLRRAGPQGRVLVEAHQAVAVPGVLGRGRLYLPHQVRHRGAHWHLPRLLRQW